MGYGYWDTKSFDDYTTKTKGVSTNAFVTADHLNIQNVYKYHELASELDPQGVMRECCDSDEHPYTLPVILALDVTGSMGGAAVRVAQKLNEIMTDLYADNSVRDIEFCVMGIGDLAYDHAPIQISQFESDIRIAEQLDKIYFEGGGGGNGYESYTAAWYMGLRHCNLDCWKRGQKGIIITMGDELPNPYLPFQKLKLQVGDNLEANIETVNLLNEVKDRFDVYHISVNDRESSYSYYASMYDIDECWRKLLGDNYFVATLDNLAARIVGIIKSHITNNFISNTGEVTW